MGKRIEYQPGQKIGNCIYLKDYPSGRKRKALFRCLYCGCEFDGFIDRVKFLQKSSCGCLQVISKSIPNLSRHKLYNVWRNIKFRCADKRSSLYSYYGARGITICEEWRNDFKAFYDYVTTLEHYGEPGMTLDREKNDQGYKPGNVRWVTQHVQTANRRKSTIGSSKYTGVYYDNASNKWIANIGINYRSKYLGGYSVEIEAVQARNQFIINNNLFEYPLQEI
ncbi:MAG TPA: hypothetical protein ENH82_03505 [bacterium]|nr:hypothetical protein [bacterium]